MLTTFFNRKENTVRWGYLTAFILLFISLLLTFYSSQQVSKQQERVHHTTNVINTQNILLLELISAESAFRGYLVLKDENILSDYYKAPHLTDSTFTKLRSLTEDNSIQQKRLETLQILIRTKLNLLSTGLLLFKNHNLTVTDTIKMMGHQGKLVMDSIKLVALKFQKDENDLLVKRSKRGTNFSNFIKVINVAAFAIAIVLALYSIIIFNKENNARKAADKQSEQFREQLEQKINELKKANTELLELRSIEKFAATGRISRTIAHEVRNPLTNINLATEHLRTEIKTTADVDILLDMITRNSNRINELINDLLNSTKAAHLNFTKVNINEMLDQSLSFVQDRIDLKKIKIIKNYTSYPLPVLADVEKIKIAFLNIILNAVEAIDIKEGAITITTETKDNRHIVTISDNGKGLDKESISKLFEPYFTTKEKGTGLGLTNTQNIVLGHNAKIYAESEKGKGSSFIISFNSA
jgi:signal transduction histidine kinase